MSKKIFKFVITGGPCGGKSTGLSLILDILTQNGYKVLIVPETATELIYAGVIPEENKYENIDFQRAILKHQIEKEKLFEEIAQIMNFDKVVIICDRGALDGKAYCDKNDFNKMLEELNINEISLRDDYDAIFHLKTAADGAENFYTLSNNNARKETIEEARELDLKTINAWTGHPHLRIIDNSTNFDDKINRLLFEIFSVLGQPIPIQIERRFLIKMPNIKYLVDNMFAEKVDIVQTYLKTKTNEEEKRIRQSGKDGNYVYFLNTKKTINNRSRAKTIEKISLKEYLTLMVSANPKLRQIIKERYCFVNSNQYFKLDIYPFWEDKAILEIELTEENQHIELPDFIEIIKEVTDDKEYKNMSIAKKIPK